MMLEKVLRLLGNGGGRVADGFQSLLATGESDALYCSDVGEAKDEDAQLSGSDGEVEKQLSFNVPESIDPEDEEKMRKFKKLKVDSNEYLEAPTSAINQMDEELVNIKADVDMLTLDNVILEKWNGKLTKRKAELTSDLKRTSDECENLKRQLKDKEEENERLRDEMKMERDEAYLKVHQFVKKLTEENLKRWER
ncbi:hypothetical protein Dimus_025128 [Dionaea muscipula]